VLKITILIDVKIFNFFWFIAPFIGEAKFGGIKLSTQALQGIRLNVIFDMTQST